MRKAFLASNLKCVSLLLLFLASPLYGAAWTNNDTPSVTDMNVNIDPGVITLNNTNPMEDSDCIEVMAASTDVTITLAGDATLQGNASGNTRLILNATTGFSITLSLVNNLTLQGSAAGAGVPDLLVVFRGLGQVIIDIDGGKKLLLTRNGVSGGAVQMYRTMEAADAAADAVARTFIRRNQSTDPAPNEDVEVEIELGSIVSYLAETAQPNATDERGTILVGGTNENGTGRTIWTLGEQAATIVRGRLVSGPAGDCFALSDIDPSTPAGSNAILSTNNSTTDTAAGILVQNFNNELGEFVWDPWCNLGVRERPPFGDFSGVQWGFIVGSYATLNVGENTYLDYVSLTGTQCVPGQDVAKVKARNPSALFTDGQPDPDFVPPLIDIQDTAGLYFRSGIDNEGNIRPLTDDNPFTIDPTKRTPGAGYPVFDIEGPLDIQGRNNIDTQVSKFELLSLEVDPTGGPLFTCGSQDIFPLRTFAKVPGQDPCTGKDETVFLTYNNASFLNNGRANLLNVSFDHTDENHHVFENNDVTSEPAYIGGETWAFKPCIPKPKWAFVGSRFNIHTSVALTGVDLLVPNGNNLGQNLTSCIDNKSQFVFYQNGKRIDNGSGRQMILGTFVGSTACDGCSVICKDAQLDVMQTSECDNSVPGDCSAGSGLRHSLCLTVTQNCDTLIEGIPAGADLIDQFSVQTIYLGNNSNISVGTNGDQGTTMDVTILTQENFPLTTCPELLIAGNFFSFETRGGENNLPCTSNVTGQGGIFVDMNGTFSIGTDNCRYRASMGAMVTQSRNGKVILPKSQVLFDPRIGEATWNLNLNDQTVIVGPETCLSDYTLNWMFVTKDYDVFCPYVVDCLNPCSCPLVTSENVNGIPTIEGQVQQLQIKGSRLGDPAHVKVNGGNVGELVMLQGYNSGEAPTAVVVLENKAKVGLGTAHRNLDSLCALIQLGLNGVTLILNSDEAEVQLNEDIIINNVCSILPGPAIAGENGTLRITADCCNTLRVTKDGVLDLSAFDDTHTLEFGGNVRVVFEPGSTVIFGTETPKLRWSENATCLFEPVVNTNGLAQGTDLTVTDTVRVKFAGSGILEFAQCARGDVPRDAFVGVEALPDCSINGAFVQMNVLDCASFHIGDSDCKTYGGAFQVGNVETTGEADQTISFSLVLDGPKALFEVGPQGFLGLGLGVVEKGDTGHDDWRIAPTANLLRVSLDLQNGIFKHSQVYAGSDARSALIALCDSIDGNAANVFNFFCDPIPDLDKFDGPLLSNTSILGGGDFVASTTDIGVFNPLVGTTNGRPDGESYARGVLTSKPLIQESAFNNVDAFAAQLFLRLQDIQDFTPVPGRAVAAQSCDHNEVRVVYVDRATVPGDGVIARADIRNIVGVSAQTTVQEHTKELGAIGLVLVPTNVEPLPPRAIVTALEIGS